jgi:hypothetical protein
VASTIEDSARVNHHARRMHFTCNNAFGLDLDAPLRKNYSIEPPGDYHAISFDLPFDFGAVTQNDGLLRNDIPFYISVDAKRPSYLQSPFERYTLIYESGPLFARAVI